MKATKSNNKVSTQMINWDPKLRSTKILSAKMMKDDDDNILWWIEYRKKQKTLSLELIMRKSFFEVLREYINNSSIGGVRQIFDPKIGWVQRLIRISIFCCMFGLVVYFLRYTWHNTLAKPLIVTSESSVYPTSAIDFPAVAVCNVNRISKKALKEYALQLHPQIAFKNETVAEVEQFCSQAGRLLDFTYSEMWNEHPFFDVIYERKFNTRGIIDMMKMLAPKCEEMLVRCAWAGEVVDCSSVFTVRRTGRGHCCAFNYILDYDSAGTPSGTVGVARRQLLPGPRQGLVVILDPMLDDYAYPLNNVAGFDVLLFDPTHFADLSAGRVTHRLAEPGRAEFMELRSIRQVAAAEVRKYPLKIRKCLFHDEVENELHRMYSYSACIVSCRIKTVQSLCKCTPYFLPTGKEEGRVCTMEDLKCLNKYKEKLQYLFPIDADKTDGLEMEMEDSLYCPACLPDCELTRHSTKSYKIPLMMLARRPYFTDKFTENINMTNKCLLSVYHATSDGMLDRLDVVAYWFEILSNIGGFGGVLIGVSVFSAVEIVYFLFVRYLLILRNNYRKYYN